MRAAVFHGEGHLCIEERPTPIPGPAQVLVEIQACGVCGTDRHIYHGDFPTTPPVIIGHEFAGQVVEVGPDVTDLAIGDRVTVDPNIYCGTCRYCQRGKVHMCTQLQALGVNLDGGFAELCVVPRKQCHLLPSNVSWIEGALAEPVACCIHGIDLAGIQSGDTVAIIGGGAIGLILAQLAKLAGAGQVIVSELAAERREIALTLGVDRVIDPRHEDPLAAGGILENGADIVIEAVGSAATARQALDWATRGGTILWFGVAPPQDRVSIAPNQVFEKELTIRGARINPFTHARAVSLLASKRLDVASLVTQRIDLDALPATLAAPSSCAIKTVVCP